MYYDENNIEFKTESQVAKLLKQANAKEMQEQEDELIEKEQATTQISNDKLQFELVDYSEKAIALFGDTKAIKDLLLAMGGKFNPRLTNNEEKQAGWIFSKNKRTELEEILNLNHK